MNIDITKDAQDKFKSAIVDEIKRRFPDTEIASPMIINNEKHFALAVNMQEIQKPDWKLDCFPMVYGGSGDSVDDATQEALNDISKIRFMKSPELVYIRSTDVFSREDFASRRVVFVAKTRIVFMYSEDNLKCALKYHKKVKST